MSESSRLTPLMEQYVNIKKEHKEEILFYRVGDFYEMFFDDAIRVSKMLNLTLTHRGEHPMCGVPYHASKVYIARLLRLGKKVAICEQIGEVPQNGGLTERKVTEIITPGTAVEEEYLEVGANNFLSCLYVAKSTCAFSYIDVSTSEFKVTSWPLSTMAENFSKEIGRCSPKELLLPMTLRDNKDIKTVLDLNPSITVSYYPDFQFNLEVSYNKLINQFKTANLKSFSLSENSIEVIPAGFLLEYLEKTTNSNLPHIKNITLYKDSQFVIIDDASRKNLEIIYNLRDGTTNYTLLDCVNYTLTAMGNRLIRNYLLSCLQDIKQIEVRQNHVEYFVKNKDLLKSIQSYLSNILDIERLASRIAMEKAHGKDLQALRVSLESCVKINDDIIKFDFALIDTDKAKYIIDLIFNSIHEDPATTLTEGRLIKRGWSEELDHYYQVQSNFNLILDNYLEEEKQKTNIPNLKIKNSTATGYCLEVTKGKLSNVPEHFIMRRAMTNADRYTTHKLQELEQELNNASSMILETEKKLFLEIRNKLQEFVPYLMNLSHQIAYIDTICSFANAAVINKWVKPTVNESLDFNIVEGRHPVVEKHLPSGEFVSNDINISAENGENSFALITGPNMAGKSTYLRQCALIALLAQTGSFVPATSATLGVVDKIFCRVGASDNLARGESTFLVEMTETALILKSSTQRSLVIMDEVGRGTSTEDGLSIAWAVSEYLLNAIKCRTFFATHYHELTRLEHKNLRLLCMDVKENGNEVIFLRKIKEGAAQNSYGIHVAQMAGIPECVVNRASCILEKLQSIAQKSPVAIDSPDIREREVTECENLHGNSATSTSSLGVTNSSSSLVTTNSATATTSTTSTGTSNPAGSTYASTTSNFDSFNNSKLPGLFCDEEIILDEILSCDLDNITPLNAMSLISRWKKTLSGR